MKRVIKKTGWLVMAAVLAFGTAACSSDDYAITEQPENPTEKTYTMTIQASKGDDATMRGLYFADGENSKDLRVNWNGKEKIRVVQNGAVIGTLSAALSSTESTTLTGTVTGFQVNQAIGFYLLADENGKMDYTGQKGAMLDDNGTGNIEENYDFASYELTGPQCMEAFTTDGSNIVPKDGVYIPFTSQQAIVRFELQKSNGSDLYATKFIVTDKNTGKLVQSIDAKSGTKTYGQVALTPNNNTSWVYNVALNLEGASDLRLFALDSDGNLYTYEKSGVTFTKGKYYRVKVRMESRDKYPLKDITPVDKQFIGWYIGASGEDGNKEYYAYNSYSADRKALIAYVGRVPNYFYDFLAIGLHDSMLDGENGRESNKNLREYIFGNSVGNYAAKNAITIGGNTYDNASYTSYSGYDIFTYDQVANSTETASNTSSIMHTGWRMPTITDWRYIIYGLCGSPSPTDPAGVGDGGRWGTSNPLAILNASPEYNLDLSIGLKYYCTSSGASVNNDHVWYFMFSQNTTPPYAPYASIGTDHGVTCYLRPVFAY